jgi:hypothetical protein
MCTHIHTVRVKMGPEVTSYFFTTFFGFFASFRAPVPFAIDFVKSCRACRFNRIGSYVSLGHDHARRDFYLLVIDILYHFSSLF